MEIVSARVLDWGVASLPIPGQAGSGDGHLVHVAPWGALVAVVDGVGHGSEAATATRIALEVLERHAQDPLPSLLGRCHERLRRTRGVALSMSAFRPTEGAMTWLGVGNVTGVLVRATPRAASRVESLVPRAGLVGDQQLHQITASATPVAAGDTLIFATDGIRSDFADSQSLSHAPREIAERVLARHGKGTDDALVLVARYLGGSG
ncbi:MAG: stage II sporulation protein E (SpoIIE) [Candidatus Eisenbacteria bacterium]|uniref:Stage II sporulation protein E (SpoIIE) n=1 Tax=Eiseniibacteriota bacterium TaxID=2212470 RepID=A0A538TC43_UNCEI|nr:MAG: stage II sporulation protein E (SpoIIE) [Candidatus Eisenbacteria bacterium]